MKTPILQSQLRKMIKEEIEQNQNDISNIFKKAGLNINSYIRVPDSMKQPLISLLNLSSDTNYKEFTSNDLTIYVYKNKRLIVISNLANSEDDILYLQNNNR